MKTGLVGGRAMAACLALWAWGLICGPLPASGEQEYTFPVLQIGARVYTNVTVTTTAKDYVFLLHSTGMNNVKLTELPDDLRGKLGYAPAKPPPSTNSWARQALAKVESPQVKEAEKQLSQALSPYMGGRQVRLDERVIGLVFAAMMLGYLFWCICLSQICKKAGHPGGLLVWLPVLQVFPMVRAAGMSGWWGLAFFVPVINLIAQVLWSIKIAQARGKGMVWGILLILPLANVLAILYLAFSSAAAEPKPAKRPIQLMTLETA